MDIGIWRCRTLTLVLCALVLCLTMAPGARGQGAGYSPSDLDDLVAPIALYPDPLLGQVLTAATFPDQIQQAAQVVQAQGPSAIASQPWDDSVKAIAGFPDVLQMMSSNMEWTGALGWAVVNQNRDVLAAVQRMRARAKEVGTLATTPQQEVVVQDQAISIVPAQPNVIYVPQYDPAVVYVDQGPYWGNTVAAGLIGFGLGYAIGRWTNPFNWHSYSWSGYGHWGGYWGGGVRPRPPYRPGTWPPNRPGTRPGAGGGGIQRPGAGGNRPGTRPGAGGGGVQRPGIGGQRPGTGGQRPGAGGGGVQRPGTGIGGQRPGAGGQRPSTLPSTRPGAPGTRPGAPGTRPGMPSTRPSMPSTRPAMPSTRPSMPTTRPAMPSTRPSPSPNFGGTNRGYAGGRVSGGGAFGGYQRSGQVAQQRARGQSSLGASRSYGGARSYGGGAGRSFGGGRPSGGGRSFGGGGGRARGGGGGRRR